MNKTIEAGDIVFRAGQRCRVIKRTVDTVWLESADLWREDEGETRGLELRDKELESPAEDRQEAVSPSQEVREQG